MMTELTLKQSAFANSFKLVLEATELSYAHSEAFSQKKTIPYRQITGVFRDADRCYIVWGSEVVYFLNEPKKPEYVTFVDQLLSRIKASRGA